MTSEKTARVYGVKYWRGELQSSRIDKIAGANKRGLWQYDVSSLGDKQLKKYSEALEAATIKEGEQIGSKSEKDKELQGEALEEGEC